RATVTAVHLIEGEVLTSRGPARVPLWAFTVAGSTERPTYPAIDLNDPGVVRVPMTHGSVRVDTRENVVVNSATATADPLRIAVTFSPPFGTASCLQVQPEAVESTSAVAVILVPRLNAPGCEPGHLSAVVTLRQPLGDRLLIDTATGYPTVVYPN
ncbi:MAG: hypothetical protein ACM3JP_01045, partial [Betaproteobacteria bacterium]